MTIASKESSQLRIFPRGVVGIVTGDPNVVWCRGRITSVFYVCTTREKHFNFNFCLTCEVGVVAVVAIEARKPLLWLIYQYVITHISRLMLIIFGKLDSCITLYSDVQRSNLDPF